MSREDWINAAFAAFNVIVGGFIVFCLYMAAFGGSC